ncbi:PHP domain-containing protein [bacterium]|nr:PHP domain-containing protein [bacterium]
MQPDRRIDYHIHTSASDGTWDSAVLLEKIREAGIQVFAVTDHDTVEQVPVMGRLAAGFPDLTFIPAVEISTNRRGREYHITVYHIDPADAGLETILRKNRAIKIEYAGRVIESLAALGKDVSTDEYRDYKADPGRGAWKLYNYLVDRGLVAEFEDYRRLQAESGITLVFPDPEEVLATLKRVDGITVLAHPAVYAGNGYLPVSGLDEWRRMGIRGIECYSHYNASAGQVEYYADYCRRHDLYISGGSDCHGEFAGRKLGYPEIFESMVTLPINP